MRSSGFGIRGMRTINLEMRFLRRREGGGEGETRAGRGVCVCVCVKEMASIIPPAKLCISPTDAAVGTPHTTTSRPPNDWIEKGWVSG